ncbi:MAG: DUF4278 domain-containing protein [Cyanobacteriota bacterium]|nr:DUF4278 domain-containing protein [Cyanobacteriota bacterium]
MNTTQLRYRGVSYSPTSCIAPTPSRQGKYRGRHWQVPPGNEDFIIASTAPLKYRGVEYFGAVRPYPLIDLLDRPWVDIVPIDNPWPILSTVG